MITFRDAIGIMLKRKDILLFSGLITLVFNFIGYFNPLSALVYSAGSFSAGSLLDGTISLVQLSTGFLSSWDRALISILAILALMAVLSIIIGLALSGYLNLINNAVGGKEVSKGDIVSGFRKNFMRIAFITFKVMLFGLLSIIFFIVSAVPAIVITSAWLSGKPGLLAAALFLGILTACVVYLGMLFFRTYIFFWYPAAFNSEKKPFTKGKKAADANFWRFAARLAAIDVCVLLLQFLFGWAQGAADQQAVLGAVAGVAVFLLNWAVATVLFAPLVIYTFALYRENQMKFNS